MYQNLVTICLQHSWSKISWKKDIIFLVEVLNRKKEQKWRKYIQTGINMAQELLMGLLLVQQKQKSLYRVTTKEWPP